MKKEPSENEQTQRMFGNGLRMNQLWLLAKSPNVVRLKNLGWVTKGGKSPLGLIWNFIRSRKVQLEFNYLTWCFKIKKGDIIYNVYAAKTRWSPIFELQQTIDTLIKNPLNWNDPPGQIKVCNRRYSRRVYNEQTGIVEAKKYVCS